ncbi:hypothetical protein [Streptomyces tendae]|uniref:hypothetical protein n=1 Tax=Streptomyces tendae TaxID=1932 RepID=UPI0024910637|nr:hypothetical protein [Streptomyces tendae]
MREVLLRLEELLFLAAPEIRVVSVQDDGEVIRVGVSQVEREAGNDTAHDASQAGEVTGPAAV